MKTDKPSRLSPAKLALILGLIPLGADALFLVLILLNQGNWAYLIPALMVLPPIHFLLGAASLWCGIKALVRKQKNAAAYIAVALSGISVIVSCFLLRFTFMFA